MVDAERRRRVQPNSTATLEQIAPQPLTVTPEFCARGGAPSRRRMA